MKPHPRVPHPYAALRKSSECLQERFLMWMAEKVLASVVMFDIALVAPLLVLPMSDSVKLLLAVLSSNWVQWWALPALQRTQMRADEKRDAKSDADHTALTYMASSLDRVEALLTKILEEKKL